MTTDPRRALAVLALVPMTAGAFAGTVAWAADRPVQAASTEPAPVTVPPAPAAESSTVPSWTTSPGATLDPRVAAVAEQLDLLRARLAALQAELAAQSEQAAQVQAEAPRMQRTAPAPRPAPPVDTTTRASG